MSAVYSVQLTSPGGGVHGHAGGVITGGQLEVDSNYSLNGSGVALVVADSPAQAVQKVISGSVDVNVGDYLNPIKWHGYSDWQNQTYTFDQTHSTLDPSVHQQGVAFYISPDGSQINLEDLAAYPTRSDWDWNTSTVDDYWKVNTKQLTADSITGTIGTQSQKSTDSGLAITENNVFAVPQSGGLMALTGDNFSSTDANILQRVRWAIQRNSADVATGIDPGITQDQTDPLKASLAMNAVGSFNAILYVDADGSGTYNAGEELKAVHIAEVGVTINDGTITTSNNNYTSATGGNRTTILSGGFPNNPAISFSETVTVLGGGADGKLAIDKIHLGWLQNGVGDSFTTTYADGHTETEVVSPESFPLLDSGRINHGTGGDTAFLSFSSEAIVGNHAGGGQDRTITSLDSPTVSFDNNFPATNSPVTSTDGTNDFSNYLVAYSDDYNEWYSPYIQLNGSARFKFANVAGVWTNSGSATTSTTVGIPNPTTLAQLGIQATGATFAESAHDVQN